MWTARVEGGPCSTNHAAVAISDEIYSFGGYCVDEINTTRRPMDVHVLNTASLRWTQIPVQSNLERVPFQRSGHTVVAYGEYAYLWGGRNEDGPCNILYRFDTGSRTWMRPRTTGETPAAREGHSASVVGCRMYVFGGIENDDERLSQEVHVLDMDAMHWRLLATRGVSPEWRSFHSAVAIGRRIYVWGGRRGSDAVPAQHPEDVAYSDRLAYLDTANGVWVHPVTRSATPLAKCSHSSFVHNDEMYVFGGYNGLLATFFGDMCKYNPENSEWSKVKPHRKGPCRCRGQCCCMVGDRMFLFGGASAIPEDTMSSGGDRIPSKRQQPTARKQAADQLHDFQERRIELYARSLTRVILTIFKILKAPLDVCVWFTCGLFPNKKKAKGGGKRS